jgi:hypothetical protein
MIADLPEFEPLEPIDLNLEPLSLDFEAVMFELGPLPKIELPEYEPFEFEPYEIELPTPMASN